MAKSLIINQINSKNTFLSVPCTSALASTFASTFLDGAYAVYELNSTTATSDIVVSADDVNIMFKNKASGKKSYMTVKVEPSTTDEAIFTVLMGLTLNGVLIDEAYVISRRSATRF